MNKNKLKKLNNGQSDLDLYEVAEFLNIKIIKIDFINELFKYNNKLQNGNYIGNLDSKTKKGTHWIGIKIYNNILVYYDSFGFRPPNLIIDYCKNNNLKCYFSINETQDLKEEICGLYVLLFFLLDSHNHITNKETFNQNLNEMKYWKIET
jgi:hypothetical protein